MAVAPFEAVYIADLDAIEGAAAISPAIERLAGRQATLPFWVDAGIAAPAPPRHFLAHDRLHPVIGSEFAERLPAASTNCGIIPGVLLSLDFRGDDFIGPRRPDRPARAVAGPGDRDDAGAGGQRQRADLRRLDQILAKAQGREVFAAGGVRGPDDAAELAARGVAGALVASAIHRRRHPLGDLRRSATPRLKAKGPRRPLPIDRRYLKPNIAANRRRSATVLSRWVVLLAVVSFLSAERVLGSVLLLDDTPAAFGSPLTARAIASLVAR